MAGVRLWVRFIMFLSSFSPLMMIWGFNFREVVIWWQISLFHVTVLLSLFSIFTLLFVVEISRRDDNPQTIKIDSIEDLNKVHIEYLLTYVFAFLPATGTSIFSFLVFLVVLLIVYLKSNLIYVNPILSLLFYDVVKVSDKGEEFIILTRRKDGIIRNEKLNISILSKGVFVETKC